jgi:glucose-6-phosphate 1-epimerase
VTDPCTRLTATGADGARLVGCAHGGHLLSWVPAGADPGADRLWTSSTAVCGPGLAIRGGIPVIFPQFAGRGPLPKHGLARDRAWQPDTSGSPGPATFRATLVDDEATRAVWPHRFSLQLVATAAGGTLTVELLVGNLDVAPLEFTAALHCYLRVRTPDATVHGLAGLTAEDNAGGGQLVVPAEPLPALGTRDWAVRDSPGPARLEDGPDLLEVLTERWQDTVVWNPGPGHGLADVEPDGERRFVCVEPAVLRPVELAPGAGWRSVLTLRTGTRE